MGPTSSLAVAYRPATRPDSIAPAPAASALQQNRSIQAWALIEAYRAYGYRRAAVNPLDASTPDVSSMPELDPHSYGLDFSDGTRRLEINLGGISRMVTVEELLALLRACYCGTLALNSEHIRNRSQRNWFHARMEKSTELSVAKDADRLRTLEQLVAAEVFEQYLAEKYSRHKRFSLEGSEGVVPLLEALIENAIRHRVDNVILGMQHRGRLNLMKNVLGVPADQILSLFSGAPQWPLSAWDLNDHLGCSTRKETPHGSARILLAHNPSHLESISPVVCGMARALQDRRGDDAGRVLPLLLHGDAAFCGQGIVMETLNLSQTRGYHVGGTVHVIVNNQIGSTVSHQHDARSTPYCADVGRAVDAPILRVNADDPDAVRFAANLAIGYRMEFGADVIIDLVGYRRHGHNASDEATLTQPAMQREIRGHRSVVDLYAEKLMRQGLVGDGDVVRMKNAAWEALCNAEPGTGGSTPIRPSPPGDGPGEASWHKPLNTAVPLAHLQTLLYRLSDAPPGFALHETIDKLRGGWRAAASNGSAAVDWCIAENLAYATLLDNGFSIRLTGMDVGRGSFYHRHAVWHDQTADTDGVNTYFPLRHIAREQGYFSIFDSPLSEEAVLGFEYGYAAQCGRDLVIWEAQMGDFVNNAQVILDQYLSSGAAKWGYSNGLVLLLPHGYEGVGPEHSSAFIGRFLSLCAEENMRVAMPTTTAQFFHLLRRQALADDRKPLVVITGKMCLLSQRASHSRLADFANGQFNPVLEAADGLDAARVTRAVITSGKLYYDLAQARTGANLNVPILRVEQLYPFPQDTLARKLAQYPRLREVVWAQEEARNHGAWHFVRDELESALAAGVSLGYAGRPAAAASAVCDAAQHAAEQRAVVAQTLDIQEVFLESR